MDLTDTYRTFHVKAAKYTFFSRTHGMFSRRDQMLGHKINLKKSKKIEITQSIFSEHNDMKLEINHKNKSPQICGD